MKTKRNRILFLPVLTVLFIVECGKISQEKQAKEYFDDDILVRIV